MPAWGLIERMSQLLAARTRPAAAQCAMWVMQLICKRTCNGQERRTSSWAAKSIKA